MMPSASPKQRVLIVGAKFGEMYLNAFMQPPEQVRVEIEDRRRLFLRPGAGNRRRSLPPRGR
ncbi:hypothetical protein, partial [Klebsiella pneumoniae]|uniref:hypothetical protein n=1 Tax=Klebsiella pneumoniae TaxID=573 RepID=UPI00272F2E4F